MKSISPESIYKEVSSEITLILKSLEKESESIELITALKSGHDQFKKLKSELDETLDHLEKNAEWNNLTIAFYGETNAGKSTLIETLRILFGEKSKLYQQKIFLQICEEHKVDDYFFDKWKTLKEELSAEDVQMNKLTLQFMKSNSKRKIFEDELTSKSEQIKLKIQNIPFWRRVVHFLWKIPEKEILKSYFKDLNNSLDETSRLLMSYNSEKSAIIKRIELIEKELHGIDLVAKELEKYQDGSIIGDGQSDFTRDLISYEINLNGNIVILLDVPGIEGKEELVYVPIMKAVRKAHVVFYVTRKAVPPQKGDIKTGNKGTLEKIKEHLGAQTEVWTIFNKSIKSPEALRTPSLINNSESESLKVLEDEMRKQLGDKHYAGSFSLSAYPAFVTSTKNFIPNSQRNKDRNKFLSNMTPSQILQKTEFRSFTQKIFSDIAKNTQKKILKSNFNKANDVVVKLKESVSNLNKITFKPLFKNLNHQAYDSTNQLESATNSLKKNIEFTTLSLINKKRESVRRKIYECIDQNIENNDLRSSLEKFIKIGMDEIEIQILEKIENNFKTFEQEVSNILDQFQEHVQEFLHDATKAENMGFNLDINIKSGFNKQGFIASIIGAIGLFFIPGPGWVALVVGVLGVVISLYKSVKSFFSSDYKMAQQRKMTDENIVKVFDSIESSYMSQLKKNTDKLEQQLSNIKTRFWIPSQQVEQVTLSLKNSAEQLDNISKTIIKKINIE
jgi:tRNA U34 5-carboxymethylaminomethyl modifying GTPase MnmE/TrmE